MTGQLTEAAQQQIRRQFLLSIIENQSWRLHGVATQGTDLDEDDIAQLIDATDKLNQAIDGLRKAHR